MRTLLAGVILLSLLGLGSGLVGAPGGGSKQTGHVFQPDQGERLFFCDAPDLNANIKVDSVTTGTTQFAMGTAELDGSNIGTHQTEDEIIYIYEGRGRVLVGEDWFEANPGTTMYVPRGVRHGFTSEGSPLRFVRVIAPQGLESRFREAGVKDMKQCHQESKEQS
jgi:mannose-6-phosphate isomerase-like protein (cupin superfamily)